MNNSTVSNDILAVICNTLKDSGYSFDSTCKDARIISGVEEAIGGWTTTNYLDKNLNPPKEVIMRMHVQYTCIYLLAEEVDHDFAECAFNYHTPYHIAGNIDGN